jgi:hypothetical protein
MKVLIMEGAMIGAWFRTARGLATPVRTAFIGSVMLSLLALQKGTLNRDGMLYVETARIYIEQGFGAAATHFNLPFLSILMALVSMGTGLNLEASGHLLNILFMAGACALLVACASRMFPEAVWPICLVILAVPGFNDYRDELVREYGNWFFIMLSFWLALIWVEKPRWSMALAVQLSLIVAALFRPEALVFFGALVMWRFFAAAGMERWRQSLMLGGLPLAGLALLMVLYASGELSISRLSGDFGRFKLAGFEGKAAALAAGLIEYAKDQAPRILVMGSLGLVPLKFFTKMSVFIVPFFYAFSGNTFRTTLSRCALFVWALIFHALVLCVFALDLQFLAGRYVAPLTLYAAPLAGYGLWLLLKRFPQGGMAMVVISLLIMAGNAISLSPGKYQYVEAGAWLARNATESERVYIESARASYYAGWRYAGTAPNRARLQKGLSAGAFDLIVLEVTRKEPDVEKLLQDLKVERVAVFGQRNEAIVIIARPVLRADQDTGTSASVIREKTLGTE